MRKVSEAGLIGLRGEVAEWLALHLGRHGILNERTLRTIFGLYLFVSRTRRVVQMFSRLAGRA